MFTMLLAIRPVHEHVHHSITKGLSWMSQKEPWWVSHLFGKRHTSSQQGVLIYGTPVSDIYGTPVGMDYLPWCSPTDAPRASCFPT